MSGGRYIRVKKEFDNFHQQNYQSPITASLFEGDLFHWKGYIPAADNTLYEGGFFKYDMIFPPDYPLQPPKVKLETKIWHPNISSQTGAIFIDFLQYENWTPALTGRTVLLSIQNLISSPDFIPERSDDRSKFEQQAREWVKLYALPQFEENKEQTKKVEIEQPRQQSS